MRRAYRAPERHSLPYVALESDITGSKKSIDDSSAPVAESCKAGATAVLHGPLIGNSNRAHQGNR